MSRKTDGWMNWVLVSLFKVLHLFKLYFSHLKIINGHLSSEDAEFCDSLLVCCFGLNGSLRQYFNVY